jgi:hypothetical protein
MMVAEPIAAVGATRCAMDKALDGLAERDKGVS